MKSEWLTKLGLQEPQTLDEFYDMLKAFKEKDPNGNGQKDEYAWGGVGTAGIVNYLRGSFGLNYHGYRSGERKGPVHSDGSKIQGTASVREQAVQGRPAGAGISCP